MLDPEVSLRSFADVPIFRHHSDLNTICTLSVNENVASHVVVSCILHLLGQETSGGEVGTTKK